jgi:hypothetical protein
MILKDGCEGRLVEVPGRNPGGKLIVPDAVVPYRGREPF